MANTTEFEMTPERFAVLVDTFGGDIGRWPFPMQAPAHARVGSDPLAARQIAEAQTFDRLLRLAPATAASPDLVERILAGAVRQPRIERARTASATGGRPSEYNVVALPRGKPRLATSTEAPWRGSSGWRFGRSQAAGAGGMLAASLLLGIWLGASGVSPPSIGTAFQGRQAMTDLDAMSEIVQSALSLELLEGSDEESL
jgi:hypothetical protein